MEPRTLEELKQYFRQDRGRFLEQLFTIEILEAVGKPAEEIFAIIVRNDPEELAQLTEQIYEEQKGKAKTEAEHVVKTNFLQLLNSVEGDEMKEYAVILLAELDGYMYRLHATLGKNENREFRRKLFNLATWLQLKIEQAALDADDRSMIRQIPGVLRAEIYPTFGEPEEAENSVLSAVQNRKDEINERRQARKREEAAAAAVGNAKRAVLEPLFARLAEQKEALTTAERALAQETARLARYGRPAEAKYQGAINAAKAAVAATEKAIRNAGGNLGAPMLRQEVPAMVPVANGPRAAGTGRPLSDEERAARILAELNNDDEEEKKGGRRKTKKRGKKSKKTKKAKKSHKSRRHQRK
jgi:hypothetical protein